VPALIKAAAMSFLALFDFDGAFGELT